MKKGFILGLVSALALGAAAVTPVFAEGTAVFESQGIHLDIPEEIRELVTVETDSPDPDTIVSVYETASQEAAKALGLEDPSAGFIFSINAVPESRMKELRCGGMDGMQVFAEDDDIYYIFTTPTDVRFVREQYDDIEEDQAQWSMINEWANKEVRRGILAHNPELDAESYTNTMLDMLLAQAAWKPGTKFELRSLDFGPDPLDPTTLPDNDYIEDLADGFTYEEVNDAEIPDGEYTVLAFETGGEEIRYDFLSGNLIRETRMVNGEEYTTFYRATAKDADDADESTEQIVKEWCTAIATGHEYSDDHDDFDDFDDNDDFDDDDEDFDD